MDPTLYKDAVDPTVMKYPYDPEKAKALLDEAGWTAGPDGFRTKGGKRLAFQLSTQVESVTAHLVQTQAQVYWKAIGADVEIKNYPSVSYFDQTTNGILAGGKFDVGLYAWSGAAEVDQSAIYSAHFMPPHGQNYPRWRNARATAAMDHANLSIDPKVQVADYKIVQQEFAKDDPSIILWFRKLVISTPSDMKEFTATPVILTPFWNPSVYHF
jgi:peptide/nickel transport system substrate-binding protein